MSSLKPVFFSLIEFVWTDASQLSLEMSKHEGTVPSLTIQSEQGYCDRVSLAEIGEEWINTLLSAKS